VGTPTSNMSLPTQDPHRATPPAQDPQDPELQDRTGKRPPSPPGQDPHGASPPAQDPQDQEI
jgi:hypothetical protein